MPTSLTKTGQPTALSPWNCTRSTVPSRFPNRNCPSAAMHGPGQVSACTLATHILLTDFSTIYPQENLKALFRPRPFPFSMSLRYIVQPSKSRTPTFRSQASPSSKSYKPKHTGTTHICHDLGHEHTKRQAPGKCPPGLRRPSLRGASLMSREARPCNVEEWKRRFGDLPVRTAVTMGSRRTAPRPSEDSRNSQKLGCVERKSLQET